jgi:hypothetical protein
MAIDSVKLFTGHMEKFIHGLEHNDSLGEGLKFITDHYTIIYQCKQNFGKYKL